MGCDYFHAQLSRLHLQAQHLHTRIKLVCGCCLFGFWDIVCVSAISSGSPTPWLTPALTGEQGRGLPACPHLLQRLRGRAAEETGRSSEMLRAATPNTWRCKQHFKHGWNGACVGNTQEHIRDLSDSHCQAAPWLEQWAQAHSTHPLSPALLQGAPAAPFRPLSCNFSYQISLFFRNCTSLLISPLLQLDMQC